HAAGERAGFVDLDRVPQAREVIGRAQARRSGADDEHALAGRRGVDGHAPTVADRLVAEKAPDAVDPDRLVELRAVAGRLARVVTDAADDRGQGVALHDRKPRGVVVALLGVVEPRLRVLARRAGTRAGRAVADVDGPLGAPRAGLVGQARADGQG